MGDGDHALHPQPGAADVAAVWPGELVDEQLITELLSDDSLLHLGCALQQVPAGGDDSEQLHCSRDSCTGASSAPAAPCISGGGGGGTVAEHQELRLPQPEAVSRALCSVYTGPTIRDIEKALSTSRADPLMSSSRRYSSPMHL